MAKKADRYRNRFEIGKAWFGPTRKGARKRLESLPPASAVVEGIKKAVDSSRNEREAMEHVTRTVDKLSEAEHRGIFKLSVEQALDAIGLTNKQGDPAKRKKVFDIIDTLVSVSHYSSSKVERTNRSRDLATRLSKALGSVKAGLFIIRFESVKKKLEKERSRQIKKAHKNQMRDI
ncbi:hypothetical protein IIC68_01445 [archaeon]|nr:hypothetical protein [archaeon]